MSYCIGKNSARYTLQGAVTLLESLGIYVKFGKVTEKGFEGVSGLSKTKFHEYPPDYPCRCRSESYVTIDNDLPLEDKKLTLSHEMAHIILGHLVGDRIEHGYNISHEQQEFEAEALGLMLCNFLFGFNAESKEQEAIVCAGVLK